jgi:hypothetical protein
MLDWTVFYPPDTRVLALPSWRSPRLYLPTQSFIQRWEDSAFYPAYRFLARLSRLSLRTSAAVGLGEVRQVQSSGWPLGEFVRDVFPNVGSAVILVGTPGPTQKITVRVLSRKGEILGYLKYAEKEAARKRLRHERRLIGDLPGKVGPEVLQFGPFGKGEALLTSALVGTRVPATLPPPEASRNFLNTLSVSPLVDLEVHPWVRQICAEGGPDLDSWLETLGDKRWPVAVQHGDFAPWNLLRRPDGTLGAIDWEYGTLEGFPHLDLAYYVLQVSALVYRHAPPKAADSTVRYLTQRPQLGLSIEEARIITRLAAYDAYLKSREDGQHEDVGLQAWRRRVWEG